MADETLENRVSTLEQTVQEQVTIRDLEGVQTALSAQIQRLGSEMRAGFSAVREGVRTGDEETRRALGEEIRAGDEETRRVLRAEIRTGDDQTRDIIEERTAEILAVVAAGDKETRGLMEERTAEIVAVVAAGDKDTQRQMRVLHEDAISRIRRTEG